MVVKCLAHESTMTVTSGDANLQNNVRKNFEKFRRHSAFGYILPPFSGREWETTTHADIDHISTYNPPTEPFVCTPLFIDGVRLGPGLMHLYPSRNRIKFIPSVAIVLSTNGKSEISFLSIHMQDIVPEPRWFSYLVGCSRRETMKLSASSTPPLMSHISKKGLGRSQRPR